MKNLSIGLVKGLRNHGFKKEHSLLGVLILLWGLSPVLVQLADSTAGVIDQSIWMLVVLSLISFLLVVGLAWWLVQRFWMNLGLPALSGMVVQFKTMEIWKQLGFYWLSFALLVLAGVGCLAAVL